MFNRIPLKKIAVCGAPSTNTFIQVSMQTLPGSSSSIPMMSSVSCSKKKWKSGKTTQVDTGCHFLILSNQNVCFLIKVLHEKWCFKSNVSHLACIPNYYFYSKKVHAVLRWIAYQSDLSSPSPTKKTF